VNEYPARYDPQRLLGEAPPFVAEFLERIRAGETPFAAAESLEGEAFDPDEDMRVLWGAGRLDWLLNPSQAEVHANYRAWEAKTTLAYRKGTPVPGKHPRAYVLDCGRRWGKDFLSCVIADEDARRKPNQLIVYFTAYSIDLAEIILPLFEIIHRLCPEDMRPVYRGSHQGKRPGLYYPSGSIVRLVGTDKNPNGLRGRFLDKGIGSECGFIDTLGRVVKTVLEPQMLTRPGASMLLNSTPPDVPGHVWDVEFVPDAKDRDAYSIKTIDDNPMLTNFEREQELESKGGRDDPDVRREFFCIRTRDSETVVIPEFDEEKHVRTWKTPDFAQTYTVLDPGIDDLCAVGFFLYDFLNDKIILQRDWAKRNAPTSEVAEVIKHNERDLWENLKYQGPKSLNNNPYQRISDVDKRMILDLNSQHGLRVSQSRKDDKHAALHALRNMIKQGRFIVDPSCKTTIAHLRNAIWNKTRTSYVRSPLYSHFDMLDVCVYAVRGITRGVDPSPPEGQRLIAQAIAAGKEIPALLERADTGRRHKGREILERAFGSRRTPSKGPSARRSGAFGRR